MNLSKLLTVTPAKIVFTSLMFTSLLSGCQTAHSQPKDKQETVMTALETIYDLSLHLNVIKFDVVSTGCTKAEDFKLDVTSMESNTIEVSLIRLKSDYCRAMPKLVEITMKLLQMNNDKATKVIVKNPISVNRPGKKKPLRFDK